MTSSSAKKVLVAVVFVFMMSGMASVLLFNLDQGQIQMSTSEMTRSVPVHMKGSAVMDAFLSVQEICGGTSQAIPAQIFDVISTNLFTLVIGTVVIDRREDQEVTLKERIADEIAVNPGVHLRELHRILGCAMGALQYHLENLEDSGEIIAIKSGNSKHFFLSDYSSEERVLKLVALSRNPTIDAILSECMKNGRVTQAFLSRELDLDKSLISYYTSSLLEADIFQKIRVFGRERPVMLTDWAQESISNLGLMN